MAMTEAQKKAVPKSERGVPSKSGTGSYPMATPKERGEAVSLAAMHHGSNSAFTDKIRAKANKLAGKKSALGSMEHHGEGSMQHGGNHTVNVHLHMDSKTKGKFKL